MAQIGEMKYCELTVDDAIAAADVLVNDFGGEVGSEEAWAQAIGHSSANSGSYYTKMADLRRYGILPSRGIEATELARRVANPPNERGRAQAVFDMLTEVDILSEIWDSLNGGEPPEDFWRVLVEITETNPKEAKEASGPIQDQYRRMKQANERIEETETSVEEEKTPQSTAESQGAFGPQGAAIYVKVGSNELRLDEVNDRYIEIAEDFLDRLKSEDGDSGTPGTEEELEQKELTENSSN